jgi:hypothetical protein
MELTRFDTCIYARTYGEHKCCAWAKWNSIPTPLKSEVSTSTGLCRKCKFWTDCREEKPVNP